MAVTVNWHGRVNAVIVAIIAIAVFVSNIIFANPCFAAAGDTTTIIDKAVLLNRGVAYYNQPQAVTSLTNEGDSRTVFTKIKFNNCGSFFIGNNISTYLTGTITAYLRKGDPLTGQTIWQNTFSGDLFASSGYISFACAPNEELNVSLYPGETLYLVVHHTLRQKGGTTIPYLDPDRMSMYEWTVSYWMTDWLIQEGVDNAQKAMIAADAAKSEATSAKNAANIAATNAANAKASADTAANQTIYNGQSAAYWAYQAAQGVNMPLVINKIQGLNLATCTTGTSFTLTINASGAIPSNLRYRAICGSYDSGWVSSNQITITGISGFGPKSVAIKVSNNPSNPDAGTIAETTFTFFKI